MGTIDYEALIAENRPARGDAVQRAQAARLAEIAENLRTLRELADTERTLETVTKPVTPERT
jgi:hypothetical protein